MPRFGKGVKTLVNRTMSGGKSKKKNNSKKRGKKKWSTITAKRQIKLKRKRILKRNQIKK